MLSGPVIVPAVASPTHSTPLSPEADKIVGPTPEALAQIEADKKAKENKRNMRIAILIGPLVGALYLLACLFPTFSAIIASLIIGVAVSALAYGSYQLYMKGSQAIDTVTKVTHDFQEGKYKELTDKAKDVMNTSVETLQTFNSSIIKIADGVDQSNMGLTGLLLQLQLNLRSVTLKAHHNLYVCDYKEFLAKKVDDLKPSLFSLPPKHNNAYVTQAPNHTILCTFLNDDNEQKTVALSIEKTESSLSEFVKNNEKKILSIINTYIVGYKMHDGKETLDAIVPPASEASAPPAPSLLLSPPSSPQAIINPASPRPIIAASPRPS